MKTRWNSIIQWWWVVVLAVAAAVAGGQVSSGVQAGQTAGTKYDGFVLVPGGSFLMGDQFGDGPWAMQEAPAREVEVDDFLLGGNRGTSYLFRDELAWAAN